VTVAITTHPLPIAGDPQVFQRLQDTLRLQADVCRTDLPIAIEAHGFARTLSAPA